jgi:hypothetical protein
MPFDIDVSQALATLVVGLGGWFLAVATAWLNYRQKQEETFHNALDWMTKGTQRRNVGIAAIEGSWKRRRFRELSTPVLCGSAIYLLLYSQEVDSPHEFNNLERIMHLLTDNGKSGKYHLQYKAVLDALRQRIKQGGTVARRQVKDRRGVDVPPTRKDPLGDWEKLIDSVASRNPNHVVRVPYLAHYQVSRPSQ